MQLDLPFVENNKNHLLVVNLFLVKILALQNTTVTKELLEKKPSVEREKSAIFCWYRKCRQDSSYNAAADLSHLFFKLYGRRLARLDQLSQFYLIQVYKTWLASE